MVAKVKMDIVEKVAVVRMDSSTINPISFELIGEMADAIKKVRDDEDITGLVLASANDKFFSIGFDLPNIIDIPDDELRRFYRLFDRLCLDLYSLPKPTISAITGHAIAGGCILALCTDQRIIADGRRLMGLNEIDLGLPVPSTTWCILKDLVGGRTARTIVKTGQLYGPDDCLRMGLVDTVAPVEAVLPKAMEAVKALGAKPGEDLVAMKRQRTGPVEKEARAMFEQNEKDFLACWRSEEGRKRLRKALDAFKPHLKHSQ